MCLIVSSYLEELVNYLILKSILNKVWSGSGLVASGPTHDLRVPSLNPVIDWPLSFGKTAEWPMITHMLAAVTLSSMRLQLYA